MLARYQMYQTLLTTSITHKATEHISQHLHNETHHHLTKMIILFHFTGQDSSALPAQGPSSGFCISSSLCGRLVSCDLKYQTQDQEVCPEKRISQLSIFNLNSSDPSG